TWLVIATTSGGQPLLEQCVQALTRHGAQVHTLRIDPAASRTELAQHLANIPGPIHTVLSLLALDQTPHPDHPAVPAGLATNLALIQTLTSREPPTPLWCLTQGAVSTAPTDPLTNPLQAQTWGLGRVAALEHPHHWAGLIDLPETLTEHTSHHRCAILTNPNHEDQLAIRNNGAH